MKYCNEVLQRVGLTDLKHVSTPIKHNLKLRTTNGYLLSDPTHYREVVGSLVYLTITRPDIAYAVHMVSQFIARPTHLH